MLIFILLLVVYIWMHITLLYMFSWMSLLSILPCLAMNILSSVTYWISDYWWRPSCEEGIVSGLISSSWQSISVATPAFSQHVSFLRSRWSISWSKCKWCSKWTAKNLPFKGRNFCKGIRAPLVELLMSVTRFRHIRAWTRSKQEVISLCLWRSICRQPSFWITIQVSEQYWGA